jgi:hypothetical protein
MKKREEKNDKVLDDDGKRRGGERAFNLEGE